jgi:phospholipid/cholesterol/gamma-HCH transport system ATP-binding protein
MAIRPRSGDSRAGLVNRFGAQVVHDGLDLEVRRGEIFGVVGGSGAGKTVLLRSILGLHRPDAGSVEMYGTNIEDLARADRDRVRPELRRVVSERGVDQFLERRRKYPIAAARISPLDRSDARRARRTESVDGGIAAGRGRQISRAAVRGDGQAGGARRALALEPKLLFLDEPTAGLDPISAAAIDELLLYLHSQLQLTVVMITHDLNTLFHTCDRVGVIVDHRMITDTLDGMMQNPNPWIQEYFQGPRARAAERDRHG